MKPKMRVMDRVLLALYALLGMIATLAIAAALASGMRLTLFGYSIELSGSTAAIVVLAIICAVALCWSIYMLVLAFRREPKASKSSVAVQNSENGSVRISLHAMDTLVKRAIGEAEGIADIKTGIVNHEDSISVNIDMTLKSDVHIPNVTMLMQQSIKNFIEEFSGIAVRDVTVMVSDIIEVTPAPPLAIEAGADAVKPAAAEPEAPPAPEPEPVPEPEPEPEAPAQEPEPAFEPVQEPEDAEAAADAEGEVFEDVTEEDDPVEDAPAAQAEAEEFSEKDIW